MKRTKNSLSIAVALSAVFLIASGCALPAVAAEKAAPRKEKAEPEVELPSLPDAAPFKVEAQGTIKVLWKDGKLRCLLDGAEIGQANLKPVLAALAQKAQKFAVLAVAVDKQVPRAEFEAIALKAKEAGVDVLLVHTAPPAGTAAGKVGLTWIFVPGPDSPVVPIIIDILPSGAVEIFEKTLAKADDVKLDGLKERLKEMRGVVTELGDPVIVWPARNTTLERYLHVVAVPAAMGFPVDPLTRKVAEEVGGGKNQKNKEGL